MQIEITYYVKTNKIIYWASTSLLSLGMLSGEIVQLLRVKQNVDGIVHLGYPLYFLTIIGVLKVLGVIAILIPKFKLLKEWAYAGFIFAMTGAIISHLASGDGVKEIIGPSLLAILTIVSWYFRPVERRIISVNQ